MKFRLLLPALLFLTSTGLGAKEPDLNLLKKDTRVFEGIIAEIVKQNFPGRFALTGAPEGVYLPGYGVVVSFHLNINRAEIRTPLGVIPGGVKEVRPTEEQFRILTRSLLEALSDYGAAFKELPGGERIAISAHVEDRGELDPTESTKIVVLTALKEDLDSVSSGRISQRDFETKVRILQY